MGTVEPETEAYAIADTKAILVQELPANSSFINLLERAGEDNFR